MKTPLIDHEGSCPVCSGPVRMALVTSHRDDARTCFHHECKDCGFVHILANDWTYADEGFSESSSTGPRVGQLERAGREYYMAEFGCEALGRDDLDVLIVGTGKSLDWKHIGDLPAVRSVTTTDFEDFSGCPNFIALDDRGERTYDLVIACEVVEHFTDPANDMADLCRDVSENGMAVLSTNVTDGSDLGRQLYVFLPGHVSYYSPESMIRLGEQNGMFVDFRVPELIADLGPRKRYIVLSRSAEVMESVSAYFGTHRFAPSEPNPVHAGGA